MADHAAAADRLQSAVFESGALMTVDKAAEVLAVSPVTIRRMVASGELPAAQLGGMAHRPLRISAATLSEKLRGWSVRG